MPHVDSYEEQADPQELEEQQGLFPNLLAMIKADHELVEGLFAQVEQMDRNVGQREAIAEQIYQALETHTQLEEQIIYPVAHAEVYEEGVQMVEGFQQAHRTVAELIDQLQSLDPQDSAYASCFQELANSVREHVEEEEATLFADLSGLPEDRLEYLADEWQQGKQRLGASAEEAHGPPRGHGRPRPGK
jgi:hemerythrin superfamily protein